MFERIDEFWLSLGFNVPWAWLLIDVIVIIVVAVVGYQIGIMLIKRSLKLSFRNRSVKEIKHQDTLLGLFKSLLRYVVIGLGLVLVLNRLGINANALFTGAGLIGALTLIVFQDVVKDIFSGFYLIFEKILVLDDLVTIGTVTGTVVSLGVRSTTLRLPNGELWTLMNRDVTQVRNLTASPFSLVTHSLQFPLTVNLQEVKNLLTNEWSTFVQTRQEIMEPPQWLGVTSIRGDAIGVEIVTKVKPLTQFAYKRDFNLFLIETLIRHQIPLAVIPMTQLVER